MNRLRNVVGFVKFAGEPEPVPSHLVEELKRQQVDGEFHREPGQYKRGDQVMVSALGQTFVGAVDRLNTNDEIVILAELFGKSVEVVRRSDQIRPAA